MINKIAITLLASLPAFGQDLYMKMESKTTGMPFASMANVKSESFYSPGKSKVVTTMMGQKQTIYTIGDQMTIVNPDLCGSFTTDEYWSEDISNSGKAKLIKLEKTDETREILGYQCKMSRVTFETQNAYAKTTNEMTAWCSEDFKKYTIESLSSGADEFSKAMAELGAVLESETKSGTIVAKMIVTEIKNDKLPGSTFEVQGCKKPLNAVEYKKELKKRERRAQTGFH
jgi:hypothetical protein